MDKLKNLVMYIDFLGVSPQLLLLNKKASSKSLFGGILTLLVALLLFSGAGYFLNLLFDRSSFNVIQNEEKNSDSFKSWKNGEFSIILLTRLQKKSYMI
jgi:hypothetical protein